MEQTPTQTRLKNFIRSEDPEMFAGVQITDRDIELIGKIASYRFIPSAYLVRLVDGNPRHIERRLFALFQFGLVKRFPSDQNREVIYYLDKKETLRLLSERTGKTISARTLESVRNNREKDYAGAAKRHEHGRLLFVNHELMISRLHFMLELAAKESNGAAQLVSFHQGPILKHSIEVPEIRYNPGEETYYELGTTEWLSHEPDAFFSLQFQGSSEPLHCFYEADRGTMTQADMRKKFRAHFHFVVGKHIHNHYGLQRIRAVLVEAPNETRFNELKEVARSPIVSGKPSPLFWFTATEFIKDIYRSRPDVILRGIWQTPLNDARYSLDPRWLMPEQ